MRSPYDSTVRVTVLVAPRAPFRDDDQLVAEVREVDDDVERGRASPPVLEGDTAVLTVDADVDGDCHLVRPGEPDRVAVGDLHARRR